MNWLLFPALLGAFTGWCIGGLFWLSWVTDRAVVRHGTDWWPLGWQIAVAGPGAWLVALIGRIAR